MSNKGMSTGAALFLTLCIMAGIGSLIGAAEPKCIESGCNNKRAEGSNYCYSHKPYGSGHSSNKSSGSYSNGSSKSSSSSGSSSSSSSTSSNSYKSTTSNTKISSSKSTSKSYSYDSYGDGYDDIYMDGDYDYDRYDNDDDYASGVDDAMEDAWDEDGEDW